MLSPNRGSRIPVRCEARPLLHRARPGNRAHGGVPGGFGRWSSGFWHDGKEGPAVRVPYGWVAAGRRARDDSSAAPQNRGTAELSLHLASSFSPSPLLSVSVHFLADASRAYTCAHAGSVCLRAKGDSTRTRRIADWWISAGGPTGSCK